MKNPRYIPLLVLLAAAAFAGTAQAQQGGDIPFETYELDNGLRVILAPDPLATAVAVNLWYDVGSRHERPGRSGFGHLFEHLMFQGSENVARGEHMQLRAARRRILNASITEDRTNYFQTLPPNRYNLGLWLESDRMRSLQITEENMQREVEVVKEERRLRIDNSPYGTSNLQAFYYAPYDPVTCFPYAHSVIGSMEDLDAAELVDVQEFFDTYYAPNNATLVLSGAFDPAEARGFIDEYFAGIPRGTDAARGLLHGAVLAPASPPDDCRTRTPTCRPPGSRTAGVEAGHADSYPLSCSPPSWSRGRRPASTSGSSATSRRRCRRRRSGCSGAGRGSS
jgi:zinc protease